MINFDYRRLLRKYMNHVGECEGITFVPGDMHDPIRLTPHEFTQEELDELHRIEGEISKASTERTLDVDIKSDTKVDGYVMISEKELAELKLAASWAKYD